MFPGTLGPAMAEGRPCRLGSNPPRRRKEMKTDTVRAALIIEDMQSRLNRWRVDATIEATKDCGVDIIFTSRRPGMERFTCRVYVHYRTHTVDVVTKLADAAYQYSVEHAPNALPERLR